MFEIGGLPMPIWMEQVAQTSRTCGSNGGSRKVSSGGGNTYVRSENRGECEERSMRPIKNTPKNQGENHDVPHLRRHSRTGITAALGPTGIGERLFPRSKVLQSAPQQSTALPNSGGSTAKPPTTPPTTGGIISPSEAKTKSQPRDMMVGLVKIGQDVSLLRRLNDLIPPKGKFETSTEYLSRLQTSGSRVALPSDVVGATFLLPGRQGDVVELDYNADRGEWLVPIRSSIKLALDCAGASGSAEIIFDDIAAGSTAVFVMHRDLARQLDRSLLDCYLFRVSDSAAQITTCSNQLNQPNGLSFQIRARLLGVKLVRSDNGEVVGSADR